MPAGSGPPFPLARADMESLATDGLIVVGLEETVDQRWRAECEGSLATAS